MFRMLVPSRHFRLVARYFGLMPAVLCCFLNCPWHPA